MNRKQILIVDDSTITRQIERRILRDLGFENVIEAANGKEALERVRGASEPIGLILLDWNMPLLNGREVLGELQADPAARRIPVTMVSAESSPERIIEAIRAGAKNYVIKPFHPRELKAKITEAMRLAEIEEPRATLSGNLSEVGLPALVQLATMTGLSGKLVIRGEGQEGEIGFASGEARTCAFGDARGTEAFMQLALLRQGTFDFRAGPPPAEANLVQSTITLLMEAMRRQDEALRA